MTVTSTTQTQYTQATNKTTATKATSAYESTTPTQTTDKMAQMQEKYKDVYTPIPETYSKADEELKTRKIYESYPDYISGPEFLKIVNSYYDELGGKKMELGLTSTQEQKDKQEMAFQKAYDLFGGEKEYMSMMKGVQEIQNNYPVNSWGKDPSIHNATELARFDNAAVYEGLEQGKSLKEAKMQAGNMRLNFMDTSYSLRNYTETLVKAGLLDSNAKQPEPETFKPNFDAPNNSTMDLRKYGIDGDWRNYNILENQNAMIAEIEKKMGQFNFMLNNESLVKNAYTELDPHYQDLGNNAGYKKIINDELVPIMNAGLDIFKNYKIYDSIDVKV